MSSKKNTVSITLAEHGTFVAKLSTISDLDAVRHQHLAVEVASQYDNSDVEYWKRYPKAVLAIIVASFIDEA